MTCANCGQAEVTPGTHCSRCGEWAAELPAARVTAEPAPGNAPQRAPLAVFFGIVIGFFGGLLADVPLIGAGWLASAGQARLAQYGTSVIWLVESLLILVALGYLLSPPARRIPAAVRIGAFVAGFVALGPLALCDVMAVVELGANRPQTTFTPQPYRQRMFTPPHRQRTFTPLPNPR